LHRSELKISATFPQKFMRFSKEGIFQQHLPLFCSVLMKIVGIFRFSREGGNTLQWTFEILRIPGHSMRVLRFFAAQGRAGSQLRWARC